MPPRSRPRPRRAAIGACLVLLLGACTDSPAPDAPAPESPAAGAVVPAQAPRESAASAGDDPIARAYSALSEDRLFTPAGDNALELLLDGLAQAEGEPVAGARRVTDSFMRAEQIAGLQQTINEVYALGLPWIEDALAAGRFDDAERVRRLLLRARPGAPEAIGLERRILDARTARVATPVAQPASSPSNAAATPASAQVAVIPAPIPPPESPAAQEPPPAPLERAALPETPVASTSSATPPAAALDPGAAPIAGAATPPPARAATPPPSTVDAALVPLRRQMPRYPPRALHRRTEGWVRVEFVVSNDGSVSDSKVLAAEPAGLFEREALDAIQRWRFAPIAQPQRSEQLFTFRPE